MKLSQEQRDWLALALVLQVAWLVNIALTLRSIPLGFKVAAVDAKADWARFARSYGGAAISIGPGRGNRLNPLDVSDALLSARVDAEGNPIDPVVLANEQGAYHGRVRIAPVKPRNLQVYWPEGNVLLDHRRRSPESQVPDYNALVRVERG